MSKDLERIIKIVFKGDNETDKAFKSVERNIGNMAGSVEKATAPIADLSTNLAKAEAALLALGVAGLAYSIKQFADFEDVMLKVKGVIGANNEEYELLTSLTKELGAQTRFTAKEAAQGLEFLALAGLSVQDAYEALPNVLQLAQASALDLGQTADIVTNIMAGYGIETENLAKTNDVLTATFTNSNTSLDQLGAAFKFVGPVAKSLGLNIEETASLLGVLGNAGYQAEMGGTALRNILLALVAPMGNTGKLMKELGVNTEELGIDFASSANALKSLGVNVKDSAGNIKPFTEIIVELEAGLSKIPDPADRTATLIEIFGKRGGPQMAALLEQGVDAIDGLEKKINSLGGITKSVADEMESGMGGSLRAFKSAFEATTLEIGESVSKSAGSALGGVTEIFRAFVSEIDSGTFDPVFNSINKAFAELENTTKTIAKNLPEALKGVKFDGAIDAMEDLGRRATKAIESILGGEVDLSTAKGLEKAIQRFVDLFEGLTRFTEGFLEGFDPVLKAIGQFGTMAAESAEKGKALGEIGGLFKTFNTAANAVDSLNKALWAFVAVTGVKGAVSGINSALGLLPGTIASVIGSAAQKVGLAGLILAADEAYGRLVRLAGFNYTTILDRTKALQEPIQNIVDVFTGKRDWWTGELIEEVETFQNKVVIAVDSIEELRKQGKEPISLDADTKTLEEKLTDLGYDLEKISEEKLVQIKAAADITEAQILLGGLENKTYNAEIDVKLKEPEKLEYFEEIDGKLIRFEIDADTTIAATKIEDTKKEAETPLELRIEMEKADLERDLANIKANAEIVQSSMEWKAKMDIAEVEANASKVESIMSSVGESVSSAGDVLGSIFGNVGDLKDAGFWNMDIKSWIREQTDIQKRGLELQESMAEVEKRYMEEKIKTMERGDALIKIDGDGLQPHLEAFMWEILSAIQVRVAEEGLDMLLGASP